MTAPDLKQPFADSSAVAKARFETWQHTDPLLDVPPALLNSVDIDDYARVTGMVWPYPAGTVDKLKPASCEFDFLGEVRHWNHETNRAEVVEINPGTPYTLRKNSIAYVYLLTEFRLPDYIAIRFNLRITHVHRGLLLGTGPLVDPGFVGRLLIPLHNLTSRDYTLKGGEGLIWVEFTKLSPNRAWSTLGRQSGTAFTPFPPGKRDLGPQQYFNKATPDGLPAGSSIPDEIKGARESAAKAERSVRLLTSVAIIAVIALVASMLNLIANANKTSADASNVISSVRADQSALVKRMDSLSVVTRRLQDSISLVRKPK